MHEARRVLERKRDQEKETKTKHVAAKRDERGKGDNNDARACVRGVNSRMPAKHSLARTIEVLGWKSVPI